MNFCGVKVDRFIDDWLVPDAGSRSSFDSQDSNDEDYYANDYPDELGFGSSEEEDRYRFGHDSFEDPYDEHGDLGDRARFMENQWASDSDASVPSDPDDRW